jgi:hypothetical protein
VDLNGSEIAKTGEEARGLKNNVFAFHFLIRVHLRSSAANYFFYLFDSLPAEVQ